MVEPKVLFEDEHLLVVDKPSGMVVNRGFGVEVSTLQDWVEEYLVISDIPVYRKYSDKDFCQRSGIVHRLDKETSGVILVAKIPEVFRALQRQFKAREVEKVYVGLVHGKVEPAEGVISACLARSAKNRKRFAAVTGGREAETSYSTTQLLNNPARGEQFSLVEFKPKTGRTHQIRVHAKYIGHPIVADTLYAGRKTARNDRTWCPRLFLHAQKLTFTHPANGERMSVEAPLPEDLKNVIASLDKMTSPEGT